MAANQVGMPDAPLLIYPRDLANEETLDQLEHKACAVAEQAAPLLLNVGR